MFKISKIKSARIIQYAIAVILLPLCNSALAITATASPTNCVSVAGAGTSWTNPARAVSSNNSFATVSLNGTTSRYLQCTGYNFSIPAGATIVGITVNVERRSNRTSNGGSQDAAMRLVQAGVIGTTDRSTATIYTTADVTEAHGSISDMWGTTWTPAQINVANFGAAFAATKPSNAGPAHTVSIDFIQISVEYTLPVGTTISITSSPTTCASVAGFGTQAWGNPARALSSNNSFATSTVDGTTTRYLRCLGYNFAIPTGATINGITVNVERKSNRTSNGGSRDAAMRLVKAGVVGTTDRSTATTYTTADFTEAHGSTSDLWGTTWTPAQINAANFGSAFAATKPDSNGPAHSVSVDYISITVTYTTGAVGPDHIRIVHDGNGLTCTPEVLTVIACANPACTAPHFTTATVTGSVTWAGAPGGSVPFSISAAGTSTVNLPVTTVQTVSLGTSAVTPTPVSASDCINTGGGSVCSLLFADSGVMLTMSDHVAETSQNISVSAVRKATNSLSCVPAFSSVTRGVNLKCAYTNPVSGTLAVRVAGSALNSAGNPASACDGTGRTISLTFDATGVANTTMQYADVGRVTLNATYTGSGATGDAGLVMTGAGSFVAAPASFAFSNVTSGLIKAGSPFNATITARNNANNATPNFGKEIVSEGATLTSNLIAPVGGVNPAIGNNNVLGASFSSGVAVLNNLSWGEVGLITITAKLTSATYLGSGLTATGTSSNIGAFTPEHFNTVTSGGMVCPAGLVCPAQFNGFVYSGKALSVATTAYNLGGVVTFNYDNTFGYSKNVTLSAVNAPGGATTNPGGGVLSVVGVPASSFTLGVANVSTPVYTLPLISTSPLIPTAPTDVYIRAVDTDSVSSLRTIPGNSIEGGMKIIIGRSKILNAYGSELLPLKMSATVQLWNGAGWINSVNDSTTSFNSNLSTAGGNIVPVIITGPLALGNLSVAGPLPIATMSSGNFNFTLNKPSVRGSADLTLNAPLYLTTGSNTGAVNPSIAGRATFGVYTGNTDLIYQREAY